MRASWIALLLSITLAAAPADAGKPDHAGEPGGKGRGSKAPHGAAGGPPHAEGGEGGGHGGGAGFSATQRRAFFEWYDREYLGGCPPGLAKQHDRCMPPGRAKKRYAIGSPLPPGVVLEPLPPALAIVLGAPPAGHRYGILDGDVVQLALGTLQVVDAIEGLANR